MKRKTRYATRCEGVRPCKGVNAKALRQDTQGVVEGWDAEKRG